MTPTELKRLYRIIKVQLEYGLDDLLPDHQLPKAPRWMRKSLFWLKNQHPEKPLGDRLRLALQELGPVWIKFGKMLSTRPDLFPPHLVYSSRSVSSSHCRPACTAARSSLAF